MAITMSPVPFLLPIQRHFWHGETFNLESKLIKYN
jgi:hypothetical protein